ncbi:MULTISPECIES: hypothetical protein [unclassified Sphingomonas]|uniref:hypothetical protein n=1 Tax=unclassified Sphingomonas TaxID=196159 RepID=UPI0006FFB5F5|nr:MULTISPECIES: hypothetical protein [unclassified Sphingomonas]KQX25343.1 hypothetical protein ASD17_21275 [Sphingomonas sp. Root1294]KQY66336.1 hypothetical protein ASD39_11080 [Sphingomonas sp. Root50]KRB90352.1 hypothetical protein ASE22_15870 [Sphingomonas sp. Root720]
MIGKLLAAFIGRKIDRRDGKGGAKGALMGVAAASLVRRAGPLALLAGGAYVAKKALDHHKAERRAAETPPPGNI